MVSEIKIEMSLLIIQFVIQSFAAPFKWDRTKTGGGTLIYIPDDIPSELVNISYISSDNEYLTIEVNVRKTNWFSICS